MTKAKRVPYDKWARDGAVVAPPGKGVPPALDAIADLVLAYKPKAKSKPARRRKRRAAKLAKKGK